MKRNVVGNTQVELVSASKVECFLISEGQNE